MKINKILYVFSIIFLVHCSELNEKPYWDEVNLDDNSIYLVFRGTNSKEGFFAREFNIKDSLSSHIGFLLKENNNWHVYHVLNFKDGASDLRKHEASLFFKPNNEAVNYASIWTMFGMDSMQFRNIKNAIHNYESKFVKFDRNFSLDNNSKLYCSEFIFKVLKDSDLYFVDLKPISIELSGIYKQYFQKDSLEYIPVDLFQTSKQFRMLKEWIFE